MGSVNSFKRNFSLVATKLRLAHGLVNHGQAACGVHQIKSC